MENKSNVRYLPTQEPRVETGNVQFGDDWRGLFLRGDTCLGFSVSLRIALEHKDPVTNANLERLLELLQGAKE